MSQKKIPELFKRIKGKMFFGQPREDFNVTITTKSGKSTVLQRLLLMCYQPNFWKSLCKIKVSANLRSVDLSEFSIKFYLVKKKSIIA